MRPIKPLHDFVLLRPIIPDKNNGGSIIFPGTDTFIPNSGEAVELGSKVQYVKVGDKVLFPNQLAPEIEHGQQFYMVRERDILGVLE